MVSSPPAALWGRAGLVRGRCCGRDTSPPAGLCGAEAPRRPTAESRGQSTRSLWCALEGAAWGDFLLKAWKRKEPTACWSPAAKGRESCVKLLNAAKAFQLL